MVARISRCHPRNSRYTASRVKPHHPFMPSAVSREKPHKPFVPSAVSRGKPSPPVHAECRTQCGVSRHRTGPSIRSLTRSLGTGPSIQRLRRPSGRTDGCKDFPMSSAKSAMYRIERKASPPVHTECRNERKPPPPVHAECRIKRKPSPPAHADGRTPGRGNDTPPQDRQRDCSGKRG